MRLSRSRNNNCPLRLIAEVAATPARFPVTLALGVWPRSPHVLARNAVSEMFDSSHRLLEQFSDAASKEYPSQEAGASALLTVTSVVRVCVTRPCSSPGGWQVLDVSSGSLLSRRDSSRGSILGKTNTCSRGWLSIQAFVLFEVWGGA